VELILKISLDGGGTWTASQAFSGPNNAFHNGQVDFGGDDNLYAFGTRDNTLTINRSNVIDSYQMDRTNAEDITSAQVVAKPWFRVHPSTGQIYVTLDAQEEDRLFVTPSLIRSSGYLNSWTTTSRADLRVSINDFNTGRATWPDDIQILFGNDSQVSLVWTWDWEPWIWPRTVWIANSTDGGDSFGEPVPILETWGPINSTSSNGQMSIVYRTVTGESQQIAVATSTDNGKTWYPSIASGDIPLYFDADHGPGIGMAPDGTIDLVFYAHDQGSLECVLDIQSWLETLPWGRVDPCSYNVYYTFSEDGGMTFSDPIQLNNKPVEGESLARFQGRSTIGSHLAIASSDDNAYPIWIGTPGEGKTQVYTIQISR
jgi:hypothetical protein